MTQPGRSEITVPYKLLISPPIESNCHPNNRRHPLPFNWQELIFTVYYPHQWSRPFGASSLSVFFGCTIPPQHYTQHCVLVVLELSVSHIPSTRTFVYHEPIGGIQPRQETLPTIPAQESAEFAKTLLML